MRFPSHVCFSFQSSRILNSLGPEHSVGAINWPPPYALGINTYLESQLGTVLWRAQSPLWTIYKHDVLEIRLHLPIGRSFPEAS